MQLVGQVLTGEVHERGAICEVVEAFVGSV